MPFGYNIRKDLYPNEIVFFKNNPTVSGMAAEDGNIVLNPYSKLSEKELRSVTINEAVRLFMRNRNINPSFNMTTDQVRYFKNSPYGSDFNAMRQSIVGRIISGDPSINPTEEQLLFSKGIAKQLWQNH